MHIKMKMSGNPDFNRQNVDGVVIPNLSCFTNGNSIATMAHVVLVPDLLVKFYATGAILLE